MADEKLNPDSKNNKPPEAAAPPGTSDPSAPDPIKRPGDPPRHEQAVIPGMGENAPAGKVIDLSGIKAAADYNGMRPIAPDVTDKPPEAAPDQKRRGRPPKAKPEAGAGKQGKAAEPRTGRPSKVDKAAREEAPPSVRDKVSRGKKADKGKETGSG
ncbi:MAG TPA: chromosome partitioning protein ParB, partial [Candidatus Fournierella merdigallinarum]|nr:chromosome partitioning protein ParB [Candidatus Fournierella merdigallinarum]